MAAQEIYSSPAEIRHRIGADGTFTLNNVSGDVRLRGVDGDEVVVRARWEGGGGDRPLPLVVRRTPDSLHIDMDDNGNWFGFRNRGGIEYDVQMPATARLDVQVVSADIDSDNLIGDQTYRTVSGDLAIEGTGGRVAATTVSGDVRVIAVKPLEASITTTSGDAEVSAPLLQPVRMKTVSGDMSVKGGFAPGPQHSVESVSGDLNIESTTGLTVDSKRGLDFSSKKSNAPMVAGDGSASLRYRSLSGDVHLRGFLAQALVPAPAPSPAPPPAPEMPREDSLEILRALERGEIDVEEASRRLEGAGTNA